MADARRVQYPQGAIAFGSTLLGIEWVIGRAKEGPIGLRSKRGTGKTMGKGGACEFRRTIGTQRSGLFSRDRLDG